VGPASIMPPMAGIPGLLMPLLAFEEASGPSMSMPEPSAVPPDFECRRCRFDTTGTVRATLLAAPGPGVDFGGAAAMGTTGFPPTVPPAELPADP